MFPEPFLLWNELVLHSFNGRVISYCMVYATFSLSRYQLDGLWGCVHFLRITLVHCRLCVHTCLQFARVYTWEWIAGSHVTLCLALWCTAEELLKQLHHLTVLWAMYEASNFSMSLPVLLSVDLLDSRGPGWRESGIHCDFDFTVPHG